MSNGVQGSFGLIGSGGDGGGAEAPRPKKQLQASTPARRLQELRREELSLREEQQERPDDPALEQKLAAVRRDLTYLRITASIAPAVDPADGRRPASSLQERTALAEADQARQAMRAETAPTTDGEKRPSVPTSFGFHSSDLIDLCASAGDGDTAQFNPAVEMLGRKWNVWMEGKLVGAWNRWPRPTRSASSAQPASTTSSSRGWRVGMSVGVETFETKFGFNSVRLGSVGLSAIPYVGFRLSDNVFASAFVGLTQITYNSNPQLGDTANFTALRVMFGGSLFGQWQYGDWRVRPILSGSYASESQNGYTNSLGNVVSGQTVTYGRVSAGPEVGYTFWGPERAWSRPALRAGQGQSRLRLVERRPAAGPVGGPAAGHAGLGLGRPGRRYALLQRLLSPRPGQLQFDRRHRPRCADRYDPWRDHVLAGITTSCARRRSAHGWCWRRRGRRRSGGRGWCARRSGCWRQAEHHAVARRLRAERGEASAGAPANAAVTGRVRSANSWLQPSRKTRSSFSCHGASMPAPSCAPSTVRSDCVVCCATVRFSESAPVSLKPACVEVEACSRANGVTKPPNDGATVSL